MESNSFIEFKQADYSIEVSVEMDYQYAKFTAFNDGITFFEYEKFTEELDKFVMDRTRRPKLTGTYDTFIEIFAPEPGIVFLQFTIGYSFASSRPFLEPRLSGQIVIDQEFLGELYNLID